MSPMSQVLRQDKYVFICIFINLYICTKIKYKNFKIKKISIFSNTFFLKK